jgi:tetraacyldisaccharide 4'-kinase
MNTTRGVGGLIAWSSDRVWEARRSMWALGWRTPERVPARVVSIGNLSVGGTGKTTLTTHLARRLAARGTRVAVVCRRYRPGPGGEGDEERLYRARLAGVAVHAGRSKRMLAREAAAAGAGCVLVDDGFSHWALERDLDLVLVDARDPEAGGALIPAGRLREPWRALQRAQFVVVSRLDPSEDPAPLFARLARRAPAARLAAGRHAVSGIRTRGGERLEGGARVRVVTGTGNPEAVARTAREAGLEVSGVSIYRDHHWFREEEARAEVARAVAQGARVLLTAKDEVRWPLADDASLVLEVAWEWVRGGEAVERAVAGEEEV